MGVNNSLQNKLPSQPEKRQSLKERIKLIEIQMGRHGTFVTDLIRLEMQTIHQFTQSRRRPHIFTIKTQLRHYAKLVLTHVSRHEIGTQNTIKLSGWESECCTGA